MIMFIFCASCLSGFAQTMFQRHYGGSDVEYGCSIIQTPDGGYLIAGSTSSYGAGSRDIYLIKTNDHGSVTWTKTFGGNNWDSPYSAKLISDNNFIIAGETSSSGAGASDVLLLKVDSIGDSLWQRTYGGSSEDGAWSVSSCTDDGFIIAGYSSSYTSGFSAVYLIRTDLNGDSLWTKTFDMNYENWANEVIQTSDGGFLIVGNTGPGDPIDLDGFAIKTNSFGDTIWTRRYGGSSFEEIKSCCQINDGNYMLCGSTASFGAGGYDIYVIKINPSGGIIWSKTIGGINGDRASKIISTNDNGFAIAGYTYDSGAGDEDIYFIRLNQYGDTLWTRTLGGQGTDWAYSVQQTTDGGFIIVGTTNSFGGNIDIYLVKTDANGVSGFEKTIPIRSSLKVYPNPSDGLFTIQWSDVSDKNKIVQIFNLQGQEIYKKSVTEDADNKTLIDLSDCSRGMYIIRFSDEKSITNSKIIIY